jgi:hypothetical protein
VNVLDEWKYAVIAKTIEKKGEGSGEKGNHTMLMTRKRKPQSSVNYNNRKRKQALPLLTVHIKFCLQNGSHRFTGVVILAT